MHNPQTIDDCDYTYSIHIIVKMRYRQFVHIDPKYVIAYHPIQFPRQFEKPGRRPNFDYPDMVRESVTKALADAKIDYSEVQQAVAAYVYGKLYLNKKCKITTNVLFGPNPQAIRRAANVPCTRSACPAFPFTM